MDNIKWLKKDSDQILSINDFPRNNARHFYRKKDKSGWWMVTKQIIIKKYIGTYLNILGNTTMDLYFIDPMSSWGMNMVTKKSGSHNFQFPGTALSAVLTSNRKKKGFSHFYINDYNLEKRKVLKNRLDVLKKNLNNVLNFSINTTEDKIDSNEWLISVMKDINKKSDFKNYLVVIDNEGMNIKFETIKELVRINEYGDFIINFQDFGIGRQIHNTEKICEFFGKELSENTKRRDLCKTYQEQLKTIGFGRIEPIKIKSSSSYYYTLLFCCRKDVISSWLTMIKRYRDQRFKNWTDYDVKRMWDIVTKKQKTLF